MTPPLIHESNLIPEGELWFAPRLSVTVFIVVGGMDLQSEMQLPVQLLSGETLKAAKRGEVAVIRGLES